MLACIWFVNINATCVCMCLQCMGLFTRMCTELIVGNGMFTYRTIEQH